MSRIGKSFLAAVGVTITREVVSPFSDLVGVAIFFAVCFVGFFLLYPLLEYADRKTSSFIARGNPRRFAAYEASAMAFGITGLTLLLLPALAWWVLLGIGLTVFAISFALLFALELWLKDKETPQ